MKPNFSKIEKIITDIEKTNAEIDKLKLKLNSYHTRLKELEHQKTQLENIDIIAAVRAVDIAPEELRIFLNKLKEQKTQELQEHADVQEADTKIEPDKEIRHDEK